MSKGCITSHRLFVVAWGQGLGNFGEVVGGEYSPNPGDSVTSVVVKNYALVETDTIM